MQGMTAVVAGATGGVGRAVVNRLLAEGVPTTALVRNPTEAVSFLALSTPHLGPVHAQHIELQLKLILMDRF